MVGGEVDDMTERAIRFLATAEGHPRQLPLILVKAWPQHPALEIAFAISVAASSLESIMSAEQDRNTATEAWKMAALVGVDVFLAREVGMPAEYAADLMAYWQAHDNYFL